MTVEEELERFYGGLRPDPDAERRVIETVTRVAPAPRRRRPALVVALSVVAVALAAVLVAALRPDAGHPNHPAAVGSSGPTSSHVILGRVTADGAPVPGARVSITLVWRPTNGHSGWWLAISAPSTATTGADGAFTLGEPADPKHGLSGAALTLIVHVELPGARRAAVERRFQQGGPLHWPAHLTFDVASRAVAVNGVTQVPARPERAGPS